MMRLKLAMGLEAAWRRFCAASARNQTNDPIKRDLARLIVEFINDDCSAAAKDRFVFRARDRLHRDLVVKPVQQRIRLARAAVFAECMIGRAALRARPVVMQWGAVAA